MKALLKNAGLGAGALSLFGLAFVTFTALSGTPLHEVAVIKHFVKAPPEVVVNGDGSNSAAADPVDRLTEREIMESGSSVLQSFLFPAPYDATGLGKLQDELKARIRDYSRKIADLREREGELAQREADLEERYGELGKIRTALQEFELELTLRGEEVARDESARKAREKESWSQLGKLFEEGDPGEQSQRLLTFTPEEASRILAGLSLERARELMDALPVDRYQEYVQAYRQRQVADSGGTAERP